MTPWETKRQELLTRLDDTKILLQATMQDPDIWHRVRQSLNRALDQVLEAQEQLKTQDHPR